MAQVFDTPINTTDQSLDRVLNAGLPVALVFFNGTSSLDDTLNRLAREYAGQVLVVKVKANENPESTRRFQIRTTPAVVTVRRAETVSKAEGVSGPEVERHVNYLLGKGPKPETAGPRPEARGARPAGATAGTTGQAGGTGRPREVTDATFEQEVLRSPEPVLVDFWAPWCGPCRMIAPIVDRMAQELSGRLRVAKVNVDDNPDIAMRYGIQSIPTMMIFKGGQTVDRWVGAQPEPAIRARVQRVLGS